MEFYRLVLGALSVWRITHLLQAEDGPWDLMVRFRRAAGNGFIGSLLDCFNCCSLWVAIPFAVFLAANWSQSVLLWLSFSAGAILLEGIIGGGQTPPPATYFESEK